MCKLLEIVWVTLYMAIVSFVVVGAAGWVASYFFDMDGFIFSGVALVYVAIISVALTVSIYGDE